MTSVRNLTEEQRKSLAVEVMERIEQHFDTEEPAPLFMPRAQYEALSPYFTGFFIVEWESPFDELTDIPPLITITDWMAAET